MRSPDLFLGDNEETMLVLARKEGQKIFVGADIVIVVVEVDGGTAKIGIEAPRDVQIVRDDANQGEDRDAGS